MTRRAIPPYPVLVAFLVVAAVTGLVTGPAALGFSDILAVLGGEGEPQARLILLHIRGPRVTAVQRRSAPLPSVQLAGS